jgi:hypothetical protein
MITSAHLHCICTASNSAGESGKTSLEMLKADPDSLKVEHRCLNHQRTHCDLAAPDLF